MIKLKLKQNNILFETRNKVRGAASSLRRYLLDIVLGNNEDHEKPNSKRNEYKFDFEFLKQNGDLFSIPVLFNVVIGANLKPKPGVEYDDESNSDEILEQPRTSGAYYPNEEKIVINLELPEIFLNLKKEDQQKLMYNKIRERLSWTVEHELIHDLNNKVGINRLIKKTTNAKALAAKAGREEPNKKDQEKAGYQILKPKNSSIYDESELKEFNYLNKLDEIVAFSYGIYQFSVREKISLLESFKKFFSRKNFDSFEYAPYLDALTKLNYLRYFRVKYPEIYKKNLSDMNLLYAEVKQKYDVAKRKHDEASGLLEENKLSKYWKQRAKARAKRAGRSNRSKVDKEWASGQQGKSEAINSTFMSLYEKDLEMSEELQDNVENMLKKFEEEKFVVPNKKNLKTRAKPGPNPYLDPEYRKTKFKSRMDYLAKKGKKVHVGDIAPIAEKIIPKEKKGDGKSSD